MKYINLHAHKPTEPAALEVRSIFAQDYQNVDNVSFFSIGVHPWHITSVDWDTCFARILEAAASETMLFVGECGLDRAIGIDFALQEECFKHQVQIAGDLSKPLIIHCVRAYNDLIRIKKITKSDIPWIIHGFDGNSEILTSLMKHDFYFSLGERFLFRESKGKYIHLIPSDRLFLETDESELSIESIYQRAAFLLQLEVAELESLVWANFSRIVKKIE